MYHHYRDSQATEIYDPHWDAPAVRLLKAAKGTGIAATAWNGELLSSTVNGLRTDEWIPIELGVIRVYYQDKDTFAVKEYCGSYDSDKW